MPLIIIFDYFAYDIATIFFFAIFLLRFLPFSLDAISSSPFRRSLRRRRFIFAFRFAMITLSSASSLLLSFFL